MRCEKELAYNMARSFYLNTLLEVLITIFFIAFAIRIFLKDVFFVLFEVDSIFLDYCRCNADIN